MLRKRAEDLVKMADKITEEFHTLDDLSGGEIFLGLAESYQIRRLAAVIRMLKNISPDLRYHITSGDTEQVTEKLDKGILDFGVIVEEPDRRRYHALPMPECDRWGIVMPADCALAQKPCVCFEDLRGLPLFCSEQSWHADIPRWCGGRQDELLLEGSFRLAYNGSVFVREGLGYLLTFEHLIGTGPASGLAFRPLAPVLETRMYLIWKKHQVFTPIADRFIQTVQAAFQESAGAPD